MMQSQTESQFRITNDFWHPVLTRLLGKRGISEEELYHCLSWNLNELPDLTCLKGMDDAAARVLLALENQEQIGIYGDYDVDGITATVLLYHVAKCANRHPREQMIKRFDFHPFFVD